jgi:hypothetical protein
MVQQNQLLKMVAMVIGCVVMTYAMRQKKQSSSIKYNIARPDGSTVCFVCFVFTQNKQAIDE